ncbi:MAG: hypothetical protein PHX87_00990 [Candidatus Peribacteraceae bacterium]|nr:hypothetical protein [Candidatus Peribacteraceae bacterium]MDD5741985.1 hypothetical protein [Candidatus Peribacteraceae bacterium]
MRSLWVLLVLIVSLACGFVFFRYLHNMSAERMVAEFELRNSKRKEHLRTVISAIKEYKVDNNGFLPGKITEDDKYICRTDVEVDCTGLVDLSVLTKEYLVTLPIDPLVLSGASTGYTIRKEVNTISIAAPQAENEDMFISTEL